MSNVGNSFAGGTNQRQSFTNQRGSFASGGRQSFNARGSFNARSSFNGRSSFSARGKTGSIHGHLPLMTGPRGSLARRNDPEAGPLMPDKQAKEEAELPSVFIQIKNLLIGSPLNLLLVFLPFSFLAFYLKWKAGFTFVFSFLALIPLAAMLGNFTEELALRSNESLGALLNASFGNATEMIISIFALRLDSDTGREIIKNSLVGSVLGNMLLVLGCSMTAAGIKQPHMRYNTDAVNVYCALLLLATMGLIVPTTFATAMQNPSPSRTLNLSRAIAVVMCVSYVLYLIFQLVTHKQFFEDIEEEAEAERDMNGELEEEEEEGPTLSLPVGIIGLGIATILISFESEFLVDTLGETADSWGLSHYFISVILLPIVGNAAEHATAVLMAYRGKMDIAVGVAVGSSIQISLFVIPMLVIISWCFGQALDLDFHRFATIALFVSVVVTNALIYDGKAHWLEGAMLLIGYIIISLAYLFEPNDGDM